MKKLPDLRIALLLLSCMALGFFNISCSSKKNHASFVTKLDMVDAYIASGNTKDALSLLKSLQKKANTPMNRIGVYKRYVTLGEKSQAEKVISTAYKKTPQNLEICALYSKFLMENGNFGTACDVASVLQGTKYGSFYTESVLRLGLQYRQFPNELFSKQKKLKIKRKKNSPKPDEKIFFDSRFITLFVDAYKNSQDSMWIKNAAILCLRGNDFDRAVSLLDREIENPSDALFWAFVLYDSGRNAESLGVLEIADSMERTVPLQLELECLKADNYFLLGDADHSQKIREGILEYEDQIFQHLAKDDVRRLLPVVYANSAIYHNGAKDPVREYQLINQMVTVFPDYVPSLSLHARYALESMSRPSEERLLTILRESGLKTMYMERMDSIPKIHISESMEKISQALRNSGDMDLKVLQQKLTDIVEYDMNNDKVASRVWTLFERNQISANEYPPQIFRYGVARLIQTGNQDSAYRVFMDYENKMHGLKKLEDVTENGKMSELSLWELEEAAWFAVYMQKVTLAREMYQHIVDTSASLSPKQTTVQVNSCIVNSLINLSVISEFLGERKKALECLNKALSRTQSATRRSYLLDLIGVASYGLGDQISAIRSLQYALYLNPENNSARLHLKQIQN